MSIYFRISKQGVGISHQQLNLLRKSNRVHQKGKITYFPIHEQDIKPEPLTKDPNSGWTSKTKRSGVIARKIGMLHDWNEWGELLPLTVLHIQNCQVLQIKTKKKDGVDALVLGAKDTKLKRVNKQQMGVFAKAGTPPKQIIMQFPITPDAVIPLGTEIVARHFLPGQFVDVTAVSKGKGFQGGMKRWGFRGQPASHGVSLAHRSIGSTGARKDPAKVWKGKKMPGRMGGKSVTVLNLRVCEIFPNENLLLVKGAVPGSENTTVKIRDAIGKHFYDTPPPFPTYIPSGKPEPESLKASFPKPWSSSLEAEDANEEHHKKIMTDMKYRAEYIQKNASRFTEIYLKALKIEGQAPPDPIVMQNLFKPLDQLDPKTVAYLKSIPYEPDQQQSTSSNNTNTNKTEKVEEPKKTEKK